MAGLCCFDSLQEPTQSHLFGNPLDYIVPLYTDRFYLLKKIAHKVIHLGIKTNSLESFAQESGRNTPVMLYEWIWFTNKSSL